VSTKSKGRSRLAIRYFDDRVLLTDAHAWAYYRVPSVSYEFTTPEEREALATNITVALAIALLKADPNKYNFGSAGVGTTPLTTGISAGGGED